MAFKKMTKTQIINPEKADRFLRMFPPRMKQLDKQIKLIEICSSSNYEWEFEKTVPYFFIVIFRNLTLTAQKFGLDVDVRINGEKIEDVYEIANDKYKELIKEES